MYKTITIGEKDYKLEYSIEASLYGDCVASVTSLVSEIGEAGKNGETYKVISELSNLPKVALTIFYAGLLEAHGSHPEGDGCVPDKQTAKKLAAQYMKENDIRDWYEIYSICTKQMEEDGFFSLTGMETMINKGMEIAPPNRAQKRAQKKISAKSS